MSDMHLAPTDRKMELFAELRKRVGGDARKAALVAELEGRYGLGSAPATAEAVPGQQMPGLFGAKRALSPAVDAGGDAPPPSQMGLSDFAAGSGGFIGSQTLPDRRLGTPQEEWGRRLADEPGMAVGHEIAKTMYHGIADPIAAWREKQAAFQNERSIDELLSKMPPDQIRRIGEPRPPLPGPSVSAPVERGPSYGQMAGETAQTIGRVGFGILGAPLAPAMTAERLRAEALARGESVGPAAEAFTTIGDVAMQGPALRAYSRDVIEPATAVSPWLGTAAEMAPLAAIPAAGRGLRAAGAVADAAAARGRAAGARFGSEQVLPETSRARATAEPAEFGTDAPLVPQIGRSLTDPVPVPPEFLPSQVQQGPSPLPGMGPVPAAAPVAPAPSPTLRARGVPDVRAEFDLGGKVRRRPITEGTVLQQTKIRKGAKTLPPVPEVRGTFDAGGKAPPAVGIDPERPAMTRALDDLNRVEEQQVRAQDVVEEGLLDREPSLPPPPAPVVETASPRAPTLRASEPAPAVPRYSPTELQATVDAAVEAALQRRLNVSEPGSAVASGPKPIAGGLRKTVQEPVAEPAPQARPVAPEAPAATAAASADTSPAGLWTRSAQWAQDEIARLEAKRSRYESGDRSAPKFTETDTKNLSAAQRKLADAQAQLDAAKAREASERPRSASPTAAPAKADTAPAPVTPSIPQVDVVDRAPKPVAPEGVVRKTVRWMVEKLNGEPSSYDIETPLREAGHERLAQVAKRLPEWVRRRQLVLEHQPLEHHGSYARSVRGGGILGIGSKASDASAVHELGHYVYDSLPDGLRAELDEHLRSYSIRDRYRDVGGSAKKYVDDYLSAHERSGGGDPSAHENFADAFAAWALNDDAAAGNLPKEIVDVVRRVMDSKNEPSVLRRSDAPPQAPAARPAPEAPPAPEPGVILRTPERETPMGNRAFREVRVRRVTPEEWSDWRLRRLVTDYEARRVMGVDRPWVIEQRTIKTEPGGTPDVGPWELHEFDRSKRALFDGDRDFEAASSRAHAGMLEEGSTFLDPEVQKWAEEGTKKAETTRRLAQIERELSEPAPNQFRRDNAQKLYQNAVDKLGPDATPEQIQKVRDRYIKKYAANAEKWQAEDRAWRKRLTDERDSLTGETPPAPEAPQSPAQPAQRKVRTKAQEPIKQPAASTPTAPEPAEPAPIKKPSSNEPPTEQTSARAAAIDAELRGDRPSRARRVELRRQFKEAVEDLGEDPPESSVRALRKRWNKEHEAELASLDAEDAAWERRLMDERESLRPPTAQNAPAQAPKSGLSPKAQAVFDEALARMRDGDVEGAASVLRRAIQPGNMDVANELRAAAPEVTPEQIARLPRDMREAAKSAFGMGRVNAWLRATVDAEQGGVPEAPAPEAPRKARLRGASKMPRKGSRKSESGRAYIPSIEDVEARWETVVRAAQAAGRRAFPRTADALVSLYDKLLVSPEARIDPGLDVAVRSGRAAERGLRYDSSETTRTLKGLAYTLTPDQIEQVGRSLNSETADLASLSPEQRATVETVRAELQRVRQMERDFNIRGEETQAEYPQGRLSRFRREREPLLSAFTRKGVRVAPYEFAKDMYGLRLNMTPEEVRRHIPSGAPVRYVGELNDTTLVKFTDSPEGKAARDALFQNLRGMTRDARGKLQKQATAAMRAGDIREGKMLHEGALDVPSTSDLVAETFDPISPESAKEMFVQSPVARLKGTMDESARRIGKATTLREIAELKLADGRPASIPVPDGVPASKAAGKAPEGYTFLSSDTGRKFGAIDGTYVENRVAEYVRGAMGEKAMSNWKGFQKAAMERFKVVKLLYAPRQWFRQFVSNMETENLMGFSNWNPKYVVTKARGLAAMRRGSKYYRALVSEGFLDPSYISNAEIGLVENEMSRMANENAGYRTTKAVLTLGASESAPGALKTVEAVLGKAFGFADAWTKASGYVYARETLGMGHDQAAAYVRKWTPSPEAVSDLVKSWSTNTIFGDPWARYRAEMARINLNALREKPIRLAMNRAQKNVIRAAAVVLGASLLSDDEETALENEQGGGAVALGRDEAGRPLALDYSYLSTVGDWMSKPGTVGKGGDDYWNRGMDLVGVGDNPLYTIAAEQISGVDRFQRPINPKGTFGGRVGSVLSSVVNTWSPSLATNHREKLTASFEGRPYTPGAPVQTPSQAILDVFFGFKLQPLDAEAALRRIRLQGQDAYSDLSSMYRGMMRRGETIDEEEKLALAQAIADDYRERADPLERLEEKQAPAKARLAGAAK